MQSIVSQYKILMHLLLRIPLVSSSMTSWFLIFLSKFLGSTRLDFERRLNLLTRDFGTNKGTLSFFLINYIWTEFLLILARAGLCFHAIVLFILILLAQQIVFIVESTSYTTTSLLAKHILKLLWYETRR